MPRSSEPGTAPVSTPVHRNKRHEKERRIEDPPLFVMFHWCSSSLRIPCKRKTLRRLLHDLLIFSFLLFELHQHYEGKR